MGRLISPVWSILFGIVVFVFKPVVSITPLVTISSPTDHLRQGSTVILTCTVVNLENDFFSQVRGTIITMVLKKQQETEP